jgi:serine protease
MKIKLSLVLIIVMFTNLFSQNTDFYYTLKGKKINLTKISGKLLAEFPNGLANPNSNLPGQKVTSKAFLVSQTQNLTNYAQVSFSSPTYLTDDGQELFYPREIILQFKKNINTLEKNTLISANNLVLLKKSLTFETYKVNGDALQISKTIFLSNIVEYCTPNFFVQFQSTNFNPPNDPYYNQQWYLNNIGQGTNDGKTTTVNADIDAPEAWTITKGNPNIIVAVLDTGVTSDHPDLPNSRQIRLNGSNFAYQVDGTNDPNDPSPTVSTTILNTSHGNACAGIIAATQDNGIGISGIAPLCKIMPIKIPLSTAGAQESDYAGAIDFAVANGADILSNSWGAPTTLQNLMPAVVFAIENAVNNNKVVVFSAGNNANRINGERGSWGYVGFPANANIPNLIAVGASDRDNLVANYSPSGADQNSGVTSGINLDMVAPSGTATNTYIQGEAGNIWTLDIPGNLYGYNSWRDTTSGLPAFGENLPNTGSNFSDYTGRMSGTSAAAPQVAAVAALIKSINPCLTVSQIKTILQQSADKIGPYDYFIDPSIPGISKQMGFGKLNAFEALQVAQQYNATSLDLVIKDSFNDNGSEPNTSTGQVMWNSQDIWVRNNQDGGLEHQNPEYGPNIPNYVYVKVTNNSCFTSTGTELLKVNWAKAATSLQWDYNWSGAYTEIPEQGASPVPMGLPIGTVTIPVLNPGQEITLSIPWNNIPDPNNYIWINPEPWHFCLLARIEAVNDPMTVAETTDLYTNVYNNNNIGWRNLTIVDVVQNITNGGDGNIGGVIQVGNPYNEPHAFYLELIKENLETGKPIYDEAEVSIKMDQKLYNAWVRGGKLAQKVDNTLDDKKKIVNDNHVLLNNILFNPNEQGTLNLTFNFLTKEITDKTHFRYNVIQKDAVTHKIIGGETYEIKKQARAKFLADAGGDKEININETVTFNALQINEPAMYNWYDIDGNLIFQGKDLTVFADVAKKYKLEVIATLDGFKDYTTVEVRLKSNTLGVIAPNPASNNVTIDYKINETGSAYLMILGGYGTTSTSNNYILDLNSIQKTIDISDYNNGFYTVVLVCNGKIVDAKTLIKQ